MTKLPPCPQCACEYTYEDRDRLVCPECGHDWLQGLSTEPLEDAPTVKDSNGNLLVDGDTVVVIKGLKVKGASSMLKVGTKVKNIRLV